MVYKLTRLVSSNESMVHYCISRITFTTLVDEHFLRINQLRLLFRPLLREKIADSIIVHFFLMLWRNLAERAGYKRGYSSSPALHFNFSISTSTIFLQILPRRRRQFRKARSNRIIFRQTNHRARVGRVCLV